MRSTAQEWRYVANFGAEASGLGPAVVKCPACATVFIRIRLSCDRSHQRPRMTHPKVSIRSASRRCSRCSRCSGPFASRRVLPRFPRSRRRLGASDWQMQQTISVPRRVRRDDLFHGPMSDAYGRRRLVLVGVVAYTFSSIGCALSGRSSRCCSSRALQAYRPGAVSSSGARWCAISMKGPQARR